MSNPRSSAAYEEKSQEITWLHRRQQPERQQLGVDDAAAHNECLQINFQPRTAAADVMLPDDWPINLPGAHSSPVDDVPMTIVAPTMQLISNRANK